MSVRLLLAIALMLAPLIAHAQAPDVASAADAATVQGTRILTMLSGQITDDQNQLKALRAQVADLQKQLEAAKKPEAPPPK
jgi:hypothetical protein